MAPVELLPELWLQIIQLLHRPLPRPTGKHSRSAVAQNDLVSCLRVNKLFHNLTAPLLYKEVVVDNLPSFVLGVDQHPAATGIESKRALIGYMERLFLEYCPKTEATYTQLLYGGDIGYMRIGLNAAGLEDLCVAESDWMAQAAAKLEGVEHKLLSISTAAFLDDQRTVWQPIRERCKKEKGWADRDGRASTALSMLLRSHRVYYCQRVFHGPLAYTITSIGRFGPQVAGNPSTSAPTVYSLRGHHTSTEYYDGCSPVLQAGNTRWYCPFDDRVGLDLHGAIEWVGSAIMNQIINRERLATPIDDLDKRKNFPPKDWTITTDIYVPPVLLTQPSKELLDRMVDHAKKEAERQDVPLSRCGNDSWRVMSIKDAPPCEGCGWHVNDL